MQIHLFYGFHEIDYVAYVHVKFNLSSASMIWWYKPYDLLFLIVIEFVLLFFVLEFLYGDFRHSLSTFLCKVYGCIVFSFHCNKIGEWRKRKPYLIQRDINELDIVTID